MAHALFDPAFAGVVDAGIFLPIIVIKIFALALRRSHARLPRVTGR
jgi:hypothetical protein